MEMQFERISVPYLKKLTDGIRTQEETLEVRLPEGMPDIGRVLGAWGQVIVRGKEWNSDQMTLSCGVMAWVLYTPEDGEGVRSVEAWLPFSAKWDLPETRYDGKIMDKCMLKGVDARSTSARKMMVRAVLCVDATGYQPEQTHIAVPGELPPDIRLLTAQYPVMLPKETGEKAFVIDEEITLSNSPKPEKLLYYTLYPEITDKKVMAGKVVFRGNGALHMLYRGADENLYTWDYELPFSQYADLDGEYSQDAVLDVLPCITALDLSVNEEGQLQLKAGLLGQYLLYDREMVTVEEFDFSPNRKLELQFEQLQLPAVLDRLTNEVQAEANTSAEVRQMVDVTVYPSCGQTVYTENGLQMTLPWQFQMLYYDMTGDIRSVVAGWEESWSVPSAQDNKADTCITAINRPQAMMGAGNVNLRADMIVQTCVSEGQGMTMLTGMEMGELEKPDPDRPSLILCRKGNRRLWDVAKETGSTVEAILMANGLEAEPEGDQVLLIPVK